MKTRSSVNLPVLVLNKGWMPNSITPVKKAISKVAAEMAKILDPETYGMYSFEEWLLFKVGEDEPFIQTANLKVKIPEIIVLTDYDRVPQREVKLTRRNLLIRDNYTCQYTGVKINMQNATADHVIPRSKGGATSWDNLVMCCLDINAKKADKTLKESGLTLLKKPVKPKWSPVYARFARLASSNVPSSWSKFIKIEGNPFEASV